MDIYFDSKGRQSTRRRVFDDVIPLRKIGEHGSISVSLQQGPIPGNVLSYSQLDKILSLQWDPTSKTFYSQDGKTKGTPRRFIPGKTFESLQNHLKLQMDNPAFLSPGTGVSDGLVMRHLKVFPGINAYRRPFCRKTNFPSWE